MSDLDPLLVSVKDGARILGVSDWQMYELLNKGEIESRYIGRRRKIVYSSLRSYFDSLPDEVRTS
jgi:excisionase family DNA binding protein